MIRPADSLLPGHVRLISRANPQRILLNHREVTVLEVLRNFPAHSELAWPDVRARILRLADEHDPRT